MERLKKIPEPEFSHDLQTCMNLNKYEYECMFVFIYLYYVLAHVRKHTNKGINLLGAECFILIGKGRKT